MMFMISGRATNRHGSPIVRDGVVAAIHEAGHSVVTAAPRRGSYAYVDYLVATSESISRRVSKVRWASDRGIRVINYAQMWRLINDGVEPVPASLPAMPEVVQETAQETARTTMADVHRQEAIERNNRRDEQELERLRMEQRINDMQAAPQVLNPSSAGTYNSETETARDRPVDMGGGKRCEPPVIGKPRRRKIVTRR